MQRRIFITGGRRGIGKAVARRFQEAGHQVFAPTREELELSSPERIRAFLDRQAGLEVDVLVNNAAENRVRPIAELPLEEWQRIVTTNLTAALLLMQAFVPGMAARRWGRVVNVSSCYSFLSRPGRAAYSASKAGLNGLTRTAALEFGHSNVLVNAVCPGFVDTELTRQNNSSEQIEALARQTALQRLASPQEIAEFVYFLASEANSYITGQVLVIDGGFSCQ